MEKILFKPGSSLILILDPIASQLSGQIRINAELLLSPEEQTREVIIQAVTDSGNAITRDYAIERTNIGVIVYRKGSEGEGCYLYVYHRKNVEIKCVIDSIVPKN